jgi:hypothetical protein
MEDGHRHLAWYEPPPALASAVVGDIVVNLRSALDHLVWGLAKPERRGKHTKFPIHCRNSEKDMKLFKAALAGVPKGAADAIERMQPYHGPGEPRDRPLAVLAELVNEDKHRSLVSVRLAVPWLDYFGAMVATLGRVEVEDFGQVLELFNTVAHDPAARNLAVVLVDPDANKWEIRMEVEAPAVQVVTNTLPQREILDALHECRITVMQALNEISVYLPPHSVTVPDRPTIPDLPLPTEQDTPETE